MLCVPASVAVCLDASMGHWFFSMRYNCDSRFSSLSSLGCPRHSEIRSAAPVHCEADRRGAGNEALSSIAYLYARDQPLLLMGRRIELVLPSGFENKYGKNACRMALAHELAHFRRRDLYWNLLVAWVSAVFFFWPPVWLAARRYYIAMEMACDEFAIRRAGLNLHDYAQLLVRLLEPVRARPYPATVLSMAWSGTFRSLSERIRSLKVEVRSRRPMHSFAGWLSFAAILVMLTPWGIAEEKTKKSKSKSSSSQSSSADYDKKYDKPTPKPKTNGSSASASASGSAFGFGSAMGAGNGSSFMNGGSGGFGGSNALGNGSAMAGGGASVSSSVTVSGNGDEKKEDPRELFLSPGQSASIPNGLPRLNNGTMSGGMKSSGSSSSSSSNGTTVSRTSEVVDGESVDITTIRNKKE